MKKNLLEFKEYKKKLYGCWTGKNIGGTLGAPFECLRGAYDIDYYTQPLSGEPIPNDDIDLQLVWLCAAERFGRAVNSEVLGEYWHWFVTPHWGEYGAGKNNMRAGISPPLSGVCNNVYKDSCGAFILSEIWACLAPGNPDVAVEYAFEDATVNHADEGLYAEIFCAALQSAAFSESDIDTLIDIGLSYIPKDCGVAKGVKVAREAYRSGCDWEKARKKLLCEVPCSFGALGTPKDRMDPDIPVGQIGYDAPANIGIVVLGLLYGGGDFGRSVCIAAGCGEDADCTAGTVGAVLGIINGIDDIPEKWTKPLGGKIKTRCINEADVGLKIPKTVEELVERILRLTPRFLYEYCDVLSEKPGYTISVKKNKDLYLQDKPVNAWYKESFLSTLSKSPYVVSDSFILVNTELDYGKEPYIRANEPFLFKLTVKNNFYMQQWIRVKWHLPPEWTVTPSADVSASLESFYCNFGIARFEFYVSAPFLDRDRYDLVVEISSVGHHSKALIPVVLFAR